MGEKNVSVPRQHDLDIPVPVNDGRRLEVVVDGLLFFGGARLAVGTMVVSSLHCDGSPHKGAADADGAVLVAARRRKKSVPTQSWFGRVAEPGWW